MIRTLRQSDRRSCPQANARLAAGFTLVELLVAIAILVILATFAISAFRGNDSDRISAATSTLRNALEGARSRAIKSGQVRGLRLITDPNDGRIVTSMIYVGAPDPGYDEDAKGVVIGNSGNWTFKTSAGTWDDLYTRGLLNFPTRIEIPKDSGNWYIAQSYQGTGTNTILLAGHYQPCQWNTSIAPSGGWSPIPTDPSNASQSRSLEYRIELSPTILPGSEPILLPQTTCIDLDGSDIPWSRPTSNIGAYGTAMDILFSPKGDIVGPAKTKGLIHLRIAASADLLLARNVVSGLPNITANGSPVVVANPEHGHKLVSIFAQTGGVIISDVFSNTSGYSTYNDSAAPSPFRYAIHGKEAK